MKHVLSIQSHVVYGHAGNSAAVFPMRRLGIDVWPLNTVQFSNHTQYPQWKGMVMPAAHLLDIVDGIQAIQQLQQCDAVLTGYIGSKEQGECIVEIVKKVKRANPNAIYLCDPVMGHPEKGCIVAPGVAEFFCETALALSDVIAPNLLELEELSGKKINSPYEAIRAAKYLCDKGPKLILVKYLSRAGFHQDKFEMLLISKEETLHISRPLIDFEKQPVGVGDLTSGLLLANLLQGKSAVEALEHVTAAVYAVVMETKNRNQYELQLVAAQNEIVSPTEGFRAKVLFD